MKKAPNPVRLTIAALVAAAALGLWGCPNPNDIGVQQYGEVDVTCVLASNQQPVANVLVQVSDATGRTDATGVAKLLKVTVGSNRPVYAHGTGLEGQPATVTVVQNQSASVTVQMAPP